MANTFIQPLFNPIPLFEQGYSPLPQHLTKFFDRHQYEETVADWQQYKGYEIPWQTNDSIKLQFQSNYSPLAVKLVKCGGREYDLGNMDAIMTNPYDTDMAIYEGTYPLTDIPAGRYQLQLSVGSPISLVLVSPVLDIKETHSDTVLLEYTNYKFKDDIIFETGFSPSKRVKGTIRYKTPARKDTLFEDQPLNQTLIKSRHYRLWTFHIGSPFGVPDYEIDLCDRIFGCSDVQIDNRYFVVSDGKWEPYEEEGYPMRGWTIELRERYNRSNKAWENDNPQTDQMGVVINVDSKGFVTGGSGTQIYSIEDVQ